MSDIAIALFIGLCAGTHIATWGMYKDSPHEGFTWARYFRSITVGGLVGLAIYQITHPTLNMALAGDRVVLYGSAYAMERALVEFWKTFIRREDQSKYFIPGMFHIFGKVIQSPGQRLGIGIGVIVFVLAVAGGVHWLETSDIHIHPLIVLLVAGSAGGWISAFGGAWKDAPIEGFETFKFFRSPGIAFFYGCIVGFFTNHYLFIMLGAIGYTISTIETYKTFFFLDRPRGKFQGMPEHFPEMRTRRFRFLPVYIAIWTLVIVNLVMAFLEPHNGISTQVFGF